MLPCSRSNFSFLPLYADRGTVSGRAMYSIVPVHCTWDRRGEGRAAMMGLQSPTGTMTDCKSALTSWSQVIVQVPLLPQRPSAPRLRQNGHPGRPIFVTANRHRDWVSCLLPGRSFQPVTGDGLNFFWTVPCRGCIPV
ncbi:hypothetical protein L227DRAFT_371741 [Lentinus tigrinus ALCF2SS1-6]|uniref:Uncharacterized protein n=1 Tax=Lentinus tigrinus ALCF2SS1-6 TaxID=1328759 RepID=A0A5C2RR55_9APHY|nr:hypothetical protein L227DRAFT_371741 [Lentinus tigrinus ALCF2SS1-6]